MVKKSKSSRKPRHKRVTIKRRPEYWKRVNVTLACKHSKDALKCETCKAQRIALGIIPPARPS